MYRKKKKLMEETQLPQLRNQGKEQSRQLHWGTGDDDDSTKYVKGSWGKNRSKNNKAGMKWKQWSKNDLEIVLRSKLVSSWQGIDFLWL